MNTKRTFSTKSKLFFVILMVAAIAVIVINYPRGKHHDIALNFSFENDSLSVHANTHEWEELPPDQRPSLTFIHGILTIRNMTHQPRHYNIGRFLLDLPDSTKERSEISYDSFGDRLLRNEALPPDTTIDINVYWGFTGTLDSSQVAALKPVPLDGVRNY